MADAILMSFLKAGLLHVDGDDAKLGKLETAAEEVGKTILKTPAKALPYALTAFDAQVADTEPVVVEVTAILAAKWPTHFNTVMGSPVAVARALLLSGLAQAAGKDIAIAAAFVAAARNVLPHVEVGPEAEIWGRLVADLEDHVEARAEEAWALPDAIVVEAPKLEVAPIEVPVVFGKVDRSKLQSALAASAGPHNEQGETLDSANPYWPGNNAQWSAQFGALAGKVLADAIDAAVRARIGPLDLDAALEPVAAAIDEQVQAALTAISTATAGLQRRSILLWWKEALYSPTLRRSYRDLSAYAAAVAMAYDLHRASPALTPMSVTAFLRETTARLPKVRDAAARPFKTIVADLTDDAAAGPLRAAAAAFNLPEGRGPVLAVIISGLPANGSDQAFRERTGVNADLEITPDALAVWLFQELQACRVTQAEPSRRSRKGAA